MTPTRGETILIVDDEMLIRWSLRQELSRAGFKVIEADGMVSGLAQLEGEEPDLLILDHMMPDGTGIDVLEKMEAAENKTPVIMLTAVDRSNIAVQAMKLGAFDYVTKPVNHEELLLVIQKALESTRLKRQVAHFLREQEQHHGFCGMIGASAPMQRIFDDLKKIAQSSCTTVLITGETGTGKELAARALHFLSPRRENPLMTVNFSALTETLVESELFGHERGAFTDARNQRKGIFELADGGTIFLDEIGEISPRLQVKLLRVLEQKAFQRVGGTTEIVVDVRIIAATNRDLEKSLSEGSFRTDFYYRLNVANLLLPPLRERGEDVLMLSEFFLQEFNTRFHKHFTGLSDGVKNMFRHYPWPGNIRELRNVLERAVLLGEGALLDLPHIEMIQNPRAEGAPADGLHAIAPPVDEDISLVEMEKRALLQALEKAGQNQSQAARLLKISRDTLRYRMKKYGLFAG